MAAKWCLLEWGQLLEEGGYYNLNYLKGAKLNNHGSLQVNTSINEAWMFC